MEVYKNLDTPQNKSFQDLLNSETEKRKIEEEIIQNNIQKDEKQKKGKLKKVQLLKPKLQKLLISFAGFILE